ncbi:Uncharacterized protein PCOAH_00048200 [Plasmodium coatneyi]|uniref:Uncharacterized protein n=1 Tax=Plasmodium coatneyi TaxID=208452 RepID=A0A1B1E6X3_9APIC|nr:Uncharacterized protein PCOAH_00048200 [Plasmodium coatneyi]ANQ10776.1 Uncharacterized protein PCOAH_00048200 [Plasmodium coatneyi]
MVNRNTSHISHVAQNEGRNSEKNFVASEDSSSCGKNTWESHKNGKDNKFPFYLKLSMFGILVLVLQCFNETTFGNTFECEDKFQGPMNLGANRSLGEFLKKVSSPKQKLKIASLPETSEEDSSITPYVEEEEEEDEEDDREKYRKMAEESYRQKMEERYKMAMEEEEARHVPGPGHNHHHHHHGPPKLTEEELIQLLKVLPPPPEALKRRFGITPGSSADKRFPFDSPEQLLQFLKFINEKHSMVCGNKSCCNTAGNCVEEDEEEEEGPSLIQNVIRDITNVAPVILPTIPPLLMMFIGTQKTYLLLYTLNLIKDAYFFLQRAKNQ